MAQRVGEVYRGIFQGCRGMFLDEGDWAQEGVRMAVAVHNLS